MTSGVLVLMPRQKPPGRTFFTKAARVCGSSGLVRKVTSSQEAVTSRVRQTSLKAKGLMLSSVVCVLIHPAKGAERR